MFSPQQIVQFKGICSSFGIGLSDDMVDKFKAYIALLLEWNQRMHLVSKGDAKPDRILRHFVDSLSIFKVIDLPKDANLLDLGSGAGFPGIPIKIVRDDIQLTLVESIRKKTLFLRKLSEFLRLEGINIVNRRAEELMDQDGFKENFYLVTAKAAGRLRDIVPLSMPFLKTGGLLVVYKGKELKREIEEITSLKEFRIRDVTRIKVPEMDLLRWVIVVKRER